ncbi:MAG: UDP-3-O-(3-hydroxymyristoyl)glucosamine N-acyltransferase [Gammaproteobacteria bacterium]|nr:UDP-3-O-(3-hydroxymyristoyl)glucosamine N-acyltransferase [Gammaproteobacteria bacterium]
MAISLGELATKFGCELTGDPDILVDSVATLENAGAGALSFLSNSKLKRHLSSTKAAVVVLGLEDAADCPVAALIVDDPYAAYARMAALICPVPAIEPGVHVSAVVHETADIASSAQICAHAYIGERAVIGEHVYVGPGTVIGPDCAVGDSCRFVANVTMPRKVTVGQRGIFHPGSIVGADGFGNATTSEGWVKVPQLGGVRIGNDVEIGSNTTVDCGAIGDTVIEDGVRIDNLCMIAHNVHIGAHTAVAAMCGFSGSSKIGRRCMFAGKSACVGHITICDDVVIGGRGTVSKDITEPGVYAASFNVEPARDWSKKVARFRRIDSLYERVRDLEKDDK